MASSWERLASVTLPSTGDTLDSGTFTAKKHLHVECYSEATGGAIQSNIRFNGTGSSDNDYVYRHSGNGGSDATRVSRNDIEPYQAANIATGTSQYVVLDIINIDGQEKLITGNTTKQNTAGAGTAPDRREFVGKYVTTSGQITSIQFVNNGGDSGDFSTNSTVTVWGADDQPSTAHDKSTITNVPAGTRYEEVDTRKIFRWKVGTATFTAKDENDQADSSSGLKRVMQIQAGHTLVGKTLTSVLFKLAAYASSGTGVYSFNLYDSDGDVKHQFKTGNTSTLWTGGQSTYAEVTGNDNITTATATARTVVAGDCLGFQNSGNADIRLQWRQSTSVGRANEITGNLTTGSFVAGGENADAYVEVVYVSESWVEKGTA